MKPACKAKPESELVFVCLLLIGGLRLEASLVMLTWDGSGSTPDPGFPKP